MPAATSRLRSLLLAGAVAATLAMAIVPAVSQSAVSESAVSVKRVQAAQGCGSASAAAGDSSRSEMVDATLCLLNHERGRRGMRPLRLNDRLSAAARRHTSDMVSRFYFSHESPSGADFVDRIRSAGYLRSAGSWFVGENLAWGSGDRSSPEEIMRSWMNSPGHRANILNRRFREIGIAVVLGAPEEVEQPAATYATEFGTRS